MIASRVLQADTQRKKATREGKSAKIAKRIPIVRNKEEIHRVTRVKKDQHRQKVQRFVAPAKQENICIPPTESQIVKIVLREK